MRVGFFLDVWVSYIVDLLFVIIFIGLLSIIQKASYFSQKMFKRLNQVPLSELQNQLSRQKDKKKLVIDVTTPRLKLERSLQFSTENIILKKPTRRVISTHRYYQKMPPQHISSSQIQKSLHKDEKLQKIQSSSASLDNNFSQESNSYMFVLIRNDNQECNKLQKISFQKQTHKQLQKEQIRYFPHPDDKMHERIQSVRCDFRPMTVQQSLGIVRDHQNNTSNEVDPFKKYLREKKHYKTYPSIFKNNDHKRSFFAIEVNRPDSKLNVENQHITHENALNKVLEKMHDADDFFNPNDERLIIYEPKPTNRYCFVCRGHFDDYREHVRSKLHLHNDLNSKIWLSIKDICKKVQASAVQEALSKTKWAKEKEKQLQKKTSQNALVSLKLSKAKSNDSKQKQKPKKQAKSKSQQKQTKKSQTKISTSFAILQKQSKEKKTKEESSKIILENNDKNQSEYVLMTQTQRKKSYETILVTTESSKTKDKNSEVTPIPFSSSHLQVNSQCSEKENHIAEGSQKKYQREREFFKLNKKKPIDTIHKRKVPISDKIVEQSHENPNFILQKQIKTLPITIQTQKIVSILHSEYQKLVPEGQTYRKPIKPTTVSLCLGSNNNQKLKLNDTKSLQKKKSSIKGKKKAEKKYLNGIYKQRTIEECFSVKDSNINKETCRIKAESNHKNQEYSMKNDEQSEKSQKGKFIGLAKTRSRQKLASVAMQKPYPEGIKAVP